MLTNAKLMDTDAVILEFAMVKAKFFFINTVVLGRIDASS